MAPLIGISACNLSEPPTASPLTGVRKSYLDAIVAGGGVPLIIPLVENEAVLRSLYGLCSGILFPGGEDIEPAHYNETPHPKLGSVSPTRDWVELRLIKWAREEAKPILGICRGIQLMNVAFSGTLFQDILSQYPDKSLHNRVAHEDFSHTLKVTKGCRLHGILGTEEISVNSRHHQAIKDLAPGLRAVGYSSDGLIEAVEGTGEGFLIGIQAHPENLWESREPRWRRLFEEFVEAARGFTSGSLAS